MADWSKPVITSTYVNYTAELLARDVSNAVWFDSNLINDSSIPNGAKRWNAANLNWEKYSGGTWTSLANSYNINISGSAQSVDFGGIQNLPNSIAGYGITNAYTKVEIDNLGVLKATLLSPNFTGNPTAPTQDISDNSTKLATTAFIKNQGYITLDTSRVVPKKLSYGRTNPYFYNTLLLNNGNVVQYGNGVTGQLGLNPGSTTIVWEPTPVMDSWGWIRGVPVTKVLNGSFFTAYLHAGGHLSISGYGGQSGFYGTTVPNTFINYNVGMYYGLYNIGVSVKDAIIISTTEYDGVYPNEGSAWWGIMALSTTGDLYLYGRVPQPSAPATGNFLEWTKATGISGITNIYQNACGHLTPMFAYSSTLNKLYTWGRSYTGNSGTGYALNNSLQPLVEVGGLPLSTSKIVDIVVEGNYSSSTFILPYAATTYVLLDNGEVWATGSNTYGQIGDGTTTQANLFKKVAGISGITSIHTSGGYYGNIVALNATTGQAWAWGCQAEVLTGYPNGATSPASKADRLVPTLIPGTYSSVFSRSCTMASAFAYFLLNTEGNVWFSGYNISNCASHHYPQQQWIAHSYVTLPILNGEKVIDIDMNCYHYTGSGSGYGNTLLMSDKNRVFSIGAATNGLLGIGYTPYTQFNSWKEIKF